MKPNAAQSAHAVAARVRARRSVSQAETRLIGRRSTTSSRPSAAAMRRSVARLRVTPPASSRATAGCVLPTREASSACVIPRGSRARLTRSASLKASFGAAVAVAPSGGLLPRALDGVPARAVSHPSRPPCRALPQSYFPLSEPPTLRLRRRVLRPRRRPSGCPSHTTAASGCMTSTGESAKPRGSRVTMALQPAASAAAAQTASSKSRHPRVNARLITAWSTGATRNTVSRSPTTRRA